MREGIAVGGIRHESHFKSKLLIGAASLAAAGVSTAAAAGAAPTDSPDKWLPYATVGGQVGDQVTGAQVHMFVPVWQDLDSLLFVRFGAGTQTRDHEIANFGLGYRTYVAPDWILGLYGGIDSARTKYSHTFWQGSVGAELMSADWDVRINGYMATKDAVKDIAGKYALYVHDTRIAVLQGQEGAYSGFDGEVGYRVFAGDNLDLRVFAGGFSFSRADARARSLGQSFDFAFPDIAGPMGRAELDLYDIDALGTQSRITITGQISHDDVRGTSGYVGASLQIPLGAGWGQGGQALDELDRRMVDPVRRQDNVLTEWQYSKPEPVIIYNGKITSQPTNTVYYVSDSTTGTGSYADPTTLDDAVGRSAHNQFVVVTDLGGPVVSSGAVIHAGETIVGGGHTFNVVGTHSSRVFSHTFAPGSGTPTLTPASAGGNIITLRDNANIYDLNFGGDFGAAIYGHAVTGVEISNVNIDGSGGGQYGIQLVQVTSQDLDVHISNSTISDVAVDGVSLTTNVSDGGTSNQSLEITNSTITGSGGSNVGVSTTVSGGSTVNQSVLIDPTVISGGGYGVYLYDYVDGGALNQAVSLSDVTFTGQTYGGVSIAATALNSGTIDQTISLDNVTVTASPAPISISGYGGYGGSVTQQIDMTNVTATGATGSSDIGVSATASYAGSVTQTGTWSNVTATTAYHDGVTLTAYATYGGTAIQSFDIAGLTATGNANSGLAIWGVAADAYGYYGPSVVAQYVSVTDSTITGNGIGILANSLANGGYAATLQDLYVGNSTIGGNSTGIYGVTAAIVNGSTQQNVTLVGDTIDGNTADGAFFAAVGFYGGFAAQTVGVYNSSLSNNGQDGLSLTAIGLSGGNVEQNLNLYYSVLDNNARSGLAVSTTRDRLQLRLLCLLFAGNAECDRCVRFVLGQWRGRCLYPQHRREWCPAKPVPLLLWCDARQQHV